MSDEKKNLYYLDELSDYKVASDDPDVRGWEVKDADNRVIGKVDNLLVSKRKEKVVYLDIEVDKSILDANHKPYRKSASSDVHEFINKDGENHLILPVGLARLNEDDKYVYTDRINHQTFAETKRKNRGANVDREYETVVLESYERGRTTADTSATPRTDRNETTGGTGRETSGTGTTRTGGSTSGTGTTGTGRDTFGTGTTGTGGSTSGTGTTGTGGTSGTGTTGTGGASGTGTTGTGGTTSGTGTTGTGATTSGTGTSGTGNDRSATSRTSNVGNDQSGTRKTGGAGTGPDAEGVRGDRTTHNRDQTGSQNTNTGASVDNSGTGRRTTDTADDDSFYDREEFDRSNYRQKR